MINRYKAGWKRKLLRESWTEGTNRFGEKELARDTTWQGCSGFNFKHVTTSSTPYYRLSHIIVKNMLIQMWSKCEVKGGSGKSWVHRVNNWKFSGLQMILSSNSHSNFTGSTCWDWHMKTHTILIAYHHYKRMWFFSHTKRVAAHHPCGR